MIPLLVFCGLFVLGMAVAVIVAIRHAVDGYEDATGFHYDMTPVQSAMPPAHSTLPSASVMAAKSS